MHPFVYTRVCVCVCAFIAGIAGKLGGWRFGLFVPLVITQPLSSSWLYLRVYAVVPLSMAQSLATTK